ncbi:MAG: methyl-coenzyme M reductase operon protein D [Methanomicrobiales archaeon]
MTDTNQYPQCRVVPARFLSPETTERLLNELVQVGGIRRLVVQGQRLPATVPYGPARGRPNPHTGRKMITVGGQEMELQVMPGMVVLELESEDALHGIREACDRVLSELTYTLQEGRYMKTQPTLSDYARYGPDADKVVLGLVDPKRKDAPIIIEGLK